MRALDYLAELNLMEVKVAGLQHRYHLLRRPPDCDALGTELHQRALERERREIERLQRIVGLMQHDECQVSALGAYFGEPLSQPCGHCSWCLDGGQAMNLPASCEPAIDERIWKEAVNLRTEQADILQDPVSFARFLCGVSSPRLSQARLGSHTLFGALAAVSFSTVLAQCRELA